MLPARTTARITMMRVRDAGRSECLEIVSVQKPERSVRIVSVRIPALCDTPSTNPRMPAMSPLCSSCR